MHPLHDWFTCLGCIKRFPTMKALSAHKGRCKQSKSVFTNLFSKQCHISSAHRKKQKCRGSLSSSSHSSSSGGQFIMLPFHELVLQSELSKVNIKGKKGSFEKAFPQNLVRTGHNHFSVSQMFFSIQVGPSQHDRTAPWWYWTWDGQREQRARRRDKCFRLGMECRPWGMLLLFWYDSRIVANTKFD